MSLSKTKKKVKNKCKIKRSCKQKRKYSGKKKYHTNKVQIVENADNKQIISLDFGQGASHDFNVYKSSKLKVHPNIKQKVDKGYVGIIAYHANTDIPKKASKKYPLTKEDKKQNRKLAKERIGIEHTNRKIKIFRIVKETYRNHKRFSFRVTLIATFHNANLITNVD
jgi:hypothetical protein